MEIIRKKGSCLRRSNLSQEPTNYVKKKAESRRQPAPSAGEWPRHPTAARRATDQRPTTARRPTPCVEKETPPPPAQTVPDTTPSHTTASRRQAS